jgi:hypothetical protein
VTRFSLRHQLATGCAGLVGEAHVAIGQDADQLAAVLDHGNAADAVRFISSCASRASHRA